MAKSSEIVNNIAEDLDESTTSLKVKIQTLIVYINFFLYLLKEKKREEIVKILEEENKSSSKVNKKKKLFK